MKPPPPVQAVLLMLIAMAFFSAMNIAIRVLAHTMPSTQMVLLRNICSLILILVWDIALHRRIPRFHTSRITGHFWRASIGIVAMELWFHAITLLPITLATALSFTTPIFSTIIAIAFLGEKAGIRRWSAIALGFVGMLVILRPGLGGVGPDALFVIGSSTMMAIAGVLVKTLTRTEPPETIVFYMALFMIPWSVLPAIPNWQSVHMHQMGLVFLVSFFSTAAHLLLARAYVRADMVMLMPFDFSRLVFTALMAYALFGETMDGYTIGGSLLIVGSTVYIAHREARLHKLKIH
jgi:drug/metabolite transporter (DMT)-like permease